MIFIPQTEEECDFFNRVYYSAIFEIGRAYDTGMYRPTPETCPMFRPSTLTMERWWHEWSPELSDSYIDSYSDELPIAVRRVCGMLEKRRRQHHRATITPAPLPA